MNENIDFIDEITHFAAKPSLDHAKKIEATFIRVGSTSEINIVKQTREEISLKIKTYDQNRALIVSGNIFDDAYHVVYNSLKTETFSRFIRSESWLNFISKEADAQLLNKVYYYQVLRVFTREKIQFFCNIFLNVRLAFTRAK